jgi:methyl-accepting chemotaxis protein
VRPLYNLDIQKKVLIAPLTASLLLVAFGAFSLFTMYGQQAANRELVEVRVAGLDASRATAHAVAAAQADVYRALALVRVKADDRIVEGIMRKRAEALESARKSLAARAGGGEEARAYAEAVAAVAAYAAQSKKAFEMSEVDVNMGAMALQGADGHYAAAIERTGAIVAHETKLLERARSDAAAGFARAVVLTVVALVAGIVVSLAWAVALSRRITRPVLTLTQALGRCAEGDLTVTVDAASNDEVGRACRAFNELSGRMRGLIREIARETEEIDRFAQGVTENGKSIARNAEQQSGAAATVAANVEQVSVSISQVNDLTTSTERSCQQTGVATEEGLGTVRASSEAARKVAQAVTRVSGLVDGLEKRSDKIASIVKAIKEIADQTNLLALNAAIEAARAGENGRGFSVVADEVRRLAERTALATVEIGEVIGAVLQETRATAESLAEGAREVNAGLEYAERAYKQMEAVRAESGRNLDNVHDIANATREQDSAVQGIARNIEQIAQMSERISAAIGENVEAAGRLASLTQSLRGSMTRFAV